MTRSRRWFLYGPLLFAAAILLFWSFLWRSAEQSLRSGLDDFADQAAANGVAVAHAPMRTRGFPFFLRGVIDDFSVQQGDRRYECARAYLDASPHAPHRVILSCGGEQSAALGDDVWTIAAGNARASIERDSARGWVAKAETGEATLTNGEARIAFKEALVNISPKEGEPDVFEASMRLMQVEGSGPGRALSIDRVDAAGALSGSADGGRTLAVYGAELSANGAVLSASGTIAVAPGGALTGRLQSRLEKPAGLVRAMAAAGLIAGDEARAAEAAVSMLAVASGGVIDAPIEFSGGRIRLAGLSLAVKERAGQP